MGDDRATLHSLWHHARKGTMSPWTEAKAWALREVWRESHQTDYGLLTYVAGKLKKKGGGKPTKEAVRRLFEKMDDDAEWYPGKYYGEPPGRPSAISETNKGVIARSLMALKESHVELTYALAVAQCPMQTKMQESHRMPRKAGPTDPPRDHISEGRPGEIRGKSRGNRRKSESKKGNQGFSTMQRLVFSYIRCTADVTRVTLL